MKKLLSFASVLAIVFLLAGCANQKIGNNIEPKTKAYYESFREKCEESGCCLSSVNNAEQAKSFIFKENTLGEVICPEGFIPNVNKCIDSYQWCSPID